MTWKSNPPGRAAKRNVVLSLALAATVAGAGIATAHAQGSHVASRATGTVIYSDWQFPDNLNPFTTSEAVSFETINGTLDGLFAYNQKAKVIPWMATSVPTPKNGGVSKDGKAITVHLKSGLQFSNGAALTSRDVKFSWLVSMDKLTGPACQGTCDNIARIDTPNKTTVVFHMKSVLAPTVPSYISFTILPHAWGSSWNGDPHAAATAIEQTSFNWEGPNFPTTGAYQVVNFVSNDRIVLHPMKHYHVFKTGGRIANLTFAFYSSKPGMEAAAANKQTDVTQNYTAADLPDLTKNSGAYKVVAVPGFIYEHLELNLDSTYNGKPNPLSNLKVRQALNLALDKYGLIQSALGVSRKEAQGLAAWTPWVNVPGLVQPYADKSINGAWDPIQKKYVTPGVGKALVDAKKLIAQTPCASGCALDFFTTSGNPTRANQEAVIAADWNKIGVKVTPNFVPASKLFAANWAENGILDHGTFQVAMFAFLGGPEPDGFKQLMEPQYIDRNQATHSSVNQNDAGISNSKITKAFTQGAHSFNSKVRAAAYKVVQVQLAQNSYWITLFFRPQIATTDGKVKNFSQNPTSGGPTWNMDVWTTSKSR